MKKIILIITFLIYGLASGNGLPNSVNIRIDYVKKKVFINNNLDKQFKLRIISEENSWNGEEAFVEADFFEVQKGKYTYKLKFRNITKLSEKKQIRDVKKTDVIEDSMIIYTSLKPFYGYQESRAESIKYKVN